MHGYLYSVYLNWVEIGANTKWKDISCNILICCRRSYSLRGQRCTGTAFSTCSADQTKQRPGPGTGVLSEIFVQIRHHVVEKVWIGKSSLLDATTESYHLWRIYWRTGHVLTQELSVDIICPCTVRCALGILHFDACWIYFTWVFGSLDSWQKTNGKAFFEF